DSQFVEFGYHWRIRARGNRKNIRTVSATRVGHMEIVYVELSGVLLYVVLHARTLCDVDMSSVGNLFKQHFQLGWPLVHFHRLGCVLKGISQMNRNLVGSFLVPPVGIAQL